MALPLVRKFPYKTNAVSFVLLLALQSAMTTCSGVLQISGDLFQYVILGFKSVF